MMNTSRHRSRGGQAYIELALTLPLVIMLLSIIIDFGRYVSTKQELISLTREGASLAMRQMDSPSSQAFSNTVAQIIANAAPANFNTDARIYVGRVFYDGVNPPKIVQYQAAGAVSKTAKILANGLNGNANLTGVLTLQTNQSVYVVEIYRKFTPVMPVTGPLFQNLMSSTNGGPGDRLSYLYDVALF
jgi:Flp pilus assembly protein TadG